MENKPHCWDWFNQGVLYCISCGQFKGDGTLKTGYFDCLDYQVMHVAARLQGVSIPDGRRHMQCFEAGKEVLDTLAQIEKTIRD